MWFSACLSLLVAVLLTNTCLVNKCEADTNGILGEDTYAHKVKGLDGGYDDGDIQWRQMHDEAMANRREDGRRELEQRRPSSFITEPSQNVYFRPDVTVSIPCGIKGPTPFRNRWTRNGQNISLYGGDSQSSITVTDGTLLIRRATHADEGYYQCLAENQFGVASSSFTLLRMAVFEHFRPRPAISYSRSIGQSLTLQCVPPLSIPRPNITWIRANETTEDDFNDFVADFDTHHVIELDKTSPRISMDEEGRLHIANLKEEDGRHGYYCMVSNHVVRSSVRGRWHTIVMRGNTGHKQADIMYSSPSESIAIVGRHFRMQCIFSGNPTPQQRWERVGSTTLPVNANVSSSGQVLEIRNVRPEDAGLYKCIGHNDVRLNSVYRAINLIVQSMPYFLEEPKDVDALIGEKAEFVCEADGSPAPDVTWTINGRALNDPSIQDKVFIQPSPSKLVIPKVTGADRMMIQCNASNRHGYQFRNFYLNPLELEQHRPSSFITELPRNVYFRPDDTVSLPCGIKATISFRYRWTKNSQNISLNGGDSQSSIKVTDDVGTLLIRRATHADEGYYQCFAENQFGVASSSLTLLRMAVFEHFRPRPAISYSRSIGQSLTLQCVPPLSIPRPNITWIRANETTEDNFNDFVADFDTHRVIELDKTSPRISMDEEGRLHIANLKEEDGRHGYYCMVRNRVVRSSVSGRWHTIVMRGNTGHKQADIMYSSPSESIAIVGKHFRMQCIFSGNPTPQQRWERLGSTTLPGNANVSSSGQVLEIRNVRPEDAGMYKCIGHNDVRLNSVHRAINLIVQSMPYFVEEPKDVDALIGEKAEFVCEADGSPAPDVTWTINGRALNDPSIQDNVFTQPYPSKLVFPKVTEADRMVIQCNASNRHGYQIRNLHLNVLVPSDIRLTNWNATSKSVTVTWHGPANQIHVRVCLKKATSCRTQSVDGNRPQHTFTGLRPGKRYNMTLTTSSGYQTDSIVFHVPRPPLIVPANVMTTYVQPSTQQIVYDRRGARKVRFHKLMSIVIKMGNSSICVLPKRLKGRYFLYQSQSDSEEGVAVELKTETLRGKVAPRELTLTDNEGRRSRVNLTAWEWPEHPSFNTTSTQLNNLVLRHAEVTITMTRSQRKAALLYDLDIVLRPTDGQLKGLVEMLNAVERLRLRSKKSKKRVPARCLDAGANFFMNLYPKRARRYRSN